MNIHSNGWTVKPLGEVAVFLDNLRVPVKDSERAERQGPYPYYGANGQVGWIDDYIFDEPLVLLAEDGGNFGSKEKSIAYRINGKTWVNNHAHVLRPRKDCDIDFLYRILSFYDVDKVVTGTTRQKLRKGDAEKLPIPLPPLPIQKQIAAILEKADAAREKRQQANHLTEQFLQSAFLEMFGDPVTNPKGWEEQTLEEVSIEIVDCPHSTPIHSSSVTEYPCIRTTELRKGYIDWSSMKYVSAVVYRERTRRLVPKEGDIVYGREGSFGEAIRIPRNVKMCLGQRTMLFRPNQDICASEYLWAAIRSEAVYRQALRITTGSTVGHLNVKAVKQFKIMLPLIVEQKKFAVLVEKVESLRAKQKESEKELENLFQSLMQRAFKGELIREAQSMSMRQNRILSTTDLHAGILGKIILAHEAKPEYLSTFGRVKGEKICHIIENVLNRDFGRTPKRLAAGPVDFRHLQGVEHRARMTKWFVATDRQGAHGKEYNSGRNMGFLINNLHAELEESEMDEVNRIIDLFVPMKTEHAEVVATVYSAWNDLLLDGNSPSDEEIVQEARETGLRRKRKLRGIILLAQLCGCGNTIWYQEARENTRFDEDKKDGVEKNSGKRPCEADGRCSQDFDKKHGYLPDKQRKAVDTVLKQAELMAEYFVA